MYENSEKKYKRTKCLLHKMASGQWQYVFLHCKSCNIKQRKLNFIVVYIKMAFELTVRDVSIKLLRIFEKYEYTNNFTKLN